MSDSIYVTLSTFAEYDPAPLDKLRESGIPFTLNRTGKRATAEQVVEEGRQATVLVAGVEPYDAPMLQRLPKLKCIARCGAGVDAIDLAAANARGVTVLNTPDVPTQAVAELAVAMMLGLCRQLPRQSELVRGRSWTRLESHLLAGRTVGLIGLGRIGRRVCELLAPFKPALIASDPAADAGWAAHHGVRVVSLEELLTTSDLISIHASSAAASKLRIGKAEISAMKPGAAIVNLARGSMVDEGALVAALSSGHLSGAAMDVFPEEPYTGPLCDLPNVILTPHSATLTVETRVAMELECVDKALRFVVNQISPAEVVR